MAIAYIGLGSNMGNPVENLRQALQKLNGIKGVEVQAVAGVFRTAPVGYEEQEWFHNTVAEITTELTPHQLLHVLLNIEAQLGRVRTIHWGPRTLDLDLLLYEDQVIEDEQLIVPHPRMVERAFVMVPLAELAPQLTVGGKTVAEVAKLLEKQQKIVGTEHEVW